MTSHHICIHVLIVTYTNDMDRNTLLQSMSRLAGAWNWPESSINITRGKKNSDYIKKERKGSKHLLSFSGELRGCFVYRTAFLSYSDDYKSTTTTSFTGVCKLLLHICELLRAGRKLFCYFFSRSVHSIWSCRSCGCCRRLKKLHWLIKSIHPQMVYLKHLIFIKGTFFFFFFSFDLIDHCAVQSQL